MKALQGLAWLLVMQSVGELLSRYLGLPFPGPVIGLVLLVLALRASVVRDSVSAVADFLLAHLSLLFVPVGVGVMTHLGLFGQYGFRLALVIVVSTWVGLGVSALVLQALMRSKADLADDGNIGAHTHD